LLTNKFSIFLTILIFSFSCHSTIAKDIKPNKLHCDVLNFRLFKKDLRFITNNNENFKDIILSINSDYLEKKFNLLVTSGPKPSGGYKLELKKIKKKRKAFHVYFYDVSPPKNSKNIAAITYPYCLLNIENLNKVKIKIKKKRSKIFPFSIFQ
jgi:hypothetical protein